MKKVTGLGFQDSGVGFYRIQQPLRFLRREGIVEEVRSLPFSGDFSMQKLQFNDRVLMEITKGSSAFITTNVWQDEDFTRMLNLRKWSGAKWVIDMDDNIYAVARDNPAHAGLNRVIPNIERCLQFCDGITVSVPNLREIYKNFNDNIFVQPNGIDFTKPYKSPDPETGKGSGKSWNQLAFKQKPHETIRIGWRGAYGHKDDLGLVSSVLAKLKEFYPEVEIVIFSSYRPVFPFPYEWHDWVDLQDFPEKLASLNLDIAIVPLVDSAYNRSKSNLNYLEMSALGVPCVLTPTVNQKDEAALYATSNHEWFESLSHLIEDKQKRRELGKQANVHVKQHYDMKTLIYPLATWLGELPYRRDLEPDSVLR